jgi:hypothetical protein
MSTFTEARGHSTAASGNRDNSRSGVVGRSASADSVRYGDLREGTVGTGQQIEAERAGDVRTLAGGVSIGVEGVPIPNAFRPVSVKIEDPQGRPLSDAIWIMSGGQFPTAARVDDEGRARLYLLSIQYSTFQLLGSSDRPGVDYVWYQAKDAEIGPLTDSATLTFKKKKIKGLYAGTGADFGGMLG